jgi:membrane protease YdiL (CAAX protease family)
VLAAKHWRPEFVLRLFALILLCFGVGGMLATLISGWGRDRGEAPSPFISLLLGHLFFQVAGLGAVHLFLRWHNRSWREGFGLNAYPAARAIAFGVALALVMLPLGYGLQEVSARCLTLLGIKVDAQATVKLLVESTTWPVRVYLAVFAVVVAPVVEECLFRGILFVVFRDAGWPRLALYGTAVAFGVMHSNLAALVPLTVFGLLLAWLYERTGSLLAPIAAHASFNLIPFLLVSFGLGVGRGS